MQDIQPQRWLDFLAAKRRETRNPRHALMIETVAEHIAAEIRSDLPNTMATLVPDPEFRAWCGYVDRETPFVNSGWEACASAYQGVMEQPGGFPLNEFEVERFFVGDDGLCMEGVMKRRVRGGDLVAPGTTPENTYDVRSRMALMASFRGDLIIGEDIYWDPRVSVELVGPNALETDLGH